MVNNTRYFMESNGQFAAYGQSVKMLKAWKQPGDITDIPKADFANYFDTRLLEDASFARSEEPDHILHHSREVGRSHQGI